MQISLSVSISSGLERLHTQFFTIFHNTLGTARKCGRLDTCCFWDKPEVDYRFSRCAKFPFFSFAIVVDVFSHGSSQKPNWYVTNQL